MTLWESINAANGEIRLQAVRYGYRGWYCIIATYDVDDMGVWEHWENLISGDNDYFEAEKFFESYGEGVYLAKGPDPDSALANATAFAERDRIERGNRGSE